MVEIKQLENCEERDLEQELRQDLGSWLGHYKEQIGMESSRYQWANVRSFSKGVSSHEGWLRFGKVRLWAFGCSKDLAKSTSRHINPMPELNTTMDQSLRELLREIAETGLENDGRATE